MSIVALKTFLSILFITSLALFANPVLASITHGTVTGYAWSNNAGWINFGTERGNVRVTDNNVGGYAWSSNYGWINLAPKNNGVNNNGEGNLSGNAWGENLGWINFSGVTISKTGIFTGTATGEVVGTINFSCDKCNVATDWRPISQRSGVGLPPDSFQGPGVTQSSPNVVINNGSGFTNNKNIVLNITAGADIKKIAVSNYPNFEDAVQENYTPTKNWTLTDSDGDKTVFVKFYTESGQWIQVKAYVYLDTVVPELTVSGLKENYNQTEEIIFGGTTEDNANLNLILDNSYGNFQADKKGEFFVTLGKLSLGKHHIELFAKDLAGNIGKTFIFDFNVISDTVLQEEKPGFFTPIIDKIKEGLKPLIPNLVPKQLQPTAKAPILKQIQDGLGFLIPQIFSPKKEQLAQLPKPIVMIPKNPQFVFSGNWNIFPRDPIKTFVLAPLPKDIAMLAQKFPEIGKTFTQVGVTKITDVEKIKNSNLNIPTLTQTLGLSKIEISPGKFIPAKGVPIASLSNIAKQQIPSDIIFAKDNTGLVDFNVALSVNNKGQTVQTIKTLVNKPLQLVVKIDKPAKSVTGMIVFKSRTQQISQSKVAVPLDALTASVMFDTPSFAKPAEVSKNISVEGSNILLDNQNQLPLEKNQDNIETRLVLSQFDYHDTGGGVYTATVFAPVVDGQYEVVTKVDYVDPEIKPEEIKLVTVVDPEGYVYEKNGDKETRILGAVASIYWLNPATKQYELWPAGDYQQDNPQTTDVRGTYSFLVPEGYYYLKVDAPGYLSYDGKPFEVKEGSGVHINIELKTKYWWLKIVDWKTLLLIIVILMLGYNFYQDKRRSAKIN